VGVEVGPVRIHPGEILFGDIDGVLVIPSSAEVEAVTRALEKVAKESLVRTAIERDGFSTIDAFAKFGVM
jgi:regulator of RNase E activity RraA